MYYIINVNSIPLKSIEEKDFKYRNKSKWVILKLILSETKLIELQI